MSSIRWLFLVALLLPATPAQAQTYNWFGISNSLWNTTSVLNWQASNGTFTTWSNGATSVAVFNNSISTNLACSTAITANSLQFNADGYVINDGGFALTLAGTDPGVSVGNGFTATIG